MKKYFVVGITICGAFLTTSSRGGHAQILDQTKFERKPFQKSRYVIEQPKVKSERELANGRTVDIKARVVEVDRKQGKYEF